MDGIFGKNKKNVPHGTFFLCNSTELSNSSAEGLESELCKLEALLTEGDTYKGNAESDAKNEVYKAEYYAAENVPKEVEEGALSVEFNALSEGLDNKLCKLEVLLTEGDTYNGNTEYKTKNEVYCSEDEAAEYAPKEIAEFFHCDELLEKYYF